MTEQRRTKRQMCQYIWEVTANAKMTTSEDRLAVSALERGLNQRECQRLYAKAKEIDLARIVQRNFHGTVVNISDKIVQVEFPEGYHGHQ